MRTLRIVTALGLAAALVSAPSIADAQVRGRAVARSAVPRPGPAPRVGRPNVVRVVPYGPYPYPYYSYPYGPTFGFGFGYGYGYGYYGYSPYYSPYAYGYPYPAYGYGYRSYGRPYGGVRIDVPQRDAEVYADGYFVGNVDSFDGALQQLNL